MIIAKLLTTLVLFSEQASFLGTPNIVVSYNTRSPNSAAKTCFVWCTLKGKLVDAFRTTISLTGRFEAITVRPNCRWIIAARGYCGGTTCDNLQDNLCLRRVRTVTFRSNISFDLTLRRQKRCVGSNLINNPVRIRL